MRRIPLTQGQFALVDDDDFEQVSAFGWYAHWSRCTRSFYAQRKLATFNGKRPIAHLHREIMGASLGEMVDHRNRDTLDNRKRNLRVCSVGQNNSNQRLRRDNLSGLKGVSWYKNRNIWRATIVVERKQKFLGFYRDPVEAAMVYDTAATELFGEFALTNKMLGLLP